MGRSVRVLILVQMIAFWPVWRWYTVRVVDASEATAALIPLLTALFVAVPSQPTGGRQHGTLGLPVLLTLAYAVGVHTTPALVQAILAMAALGATWIALFVNDASLARLGLFLLAVPVLPSLQFYLGYPLRLVVAAFAAAHLHVNGLDVSAEGAGLRWGTRFVLVDAPCSGVRLLWGGLYVALSAALLHRLGAKPTTLLVLLACAGSVLANSLRAAALFYAETGIIELPNWGHEVVGLGIFLGLGAVIASAAHSMAARS